MMDDTEKEQMYAAAWKHWGTSKQMDKCAEENAELIQAILHTRCEGGMFSYSVYEELADVIVSVEQVKLKLQSIPSSDGGVLWDNVLKIKEEKLKRMEERLIKSMEENEDAE